MGVKVRERKGTYRYFTFVLLTLLISSSLAVAAFGGQFEDAMAAIEHGDYTTAFRLMKPLAEQGEAEAQFHLGVMYTIGKGVPRDYTGGGKWFRWAAEQGFVEAQFNLGVHYASGIGIPQDYVSAHMWYNLPAQRYSASERKYQKEAKKRRDRVASKM